MVSMSANAYDSKVWRYSVGKDKLNDDEYSNAYSSSVKYRYNNYFKLNFRCNKGDVRFEVSTGTLIQSKGRPFSFIYRVDKRPSQKIKMKTYSNQGQGGYTYDSAVKVANDILGGTSIFVRAITWNNEYLEANIPLKSSDSNIKKVFSDCNQTINEKSPVTVSRYTFSQFKQDFEKLSVKKQNLILEQLRVKVGSK